MGANLSLSNEMSRKHDRKMGRTYVHVMNNSDHGGKINEVWGAVVCTCARVELEEMNP